MSELFPSILAVRKPKVEAEEIHEAPPRNDGLGWMA
jgi:hypothetical protein